MLFSKNFFTNLLRICSTLFTIFPNFFTFSKKLSLNIFEF
jgi:hypothetical protein